MRERPYRPLRQIDRVAEFVNLADKRGHRREAGFGHRLKLPRLDPDVPTEIPPILCAF
jgi:hypothetical protein